MIQWIFRPGQESIVSIHTLRFLHEFSLISGMGMGEFSGGSGHFDGIDGKCRGVR